VVGFDPVVGVPLGGQATDYHPAETRITPTKAFELVRQLVATDERPTCVEWDEQARTGSQEPSDAGESADDPWN
jgi:hypothetical protein